MKFIKAPSSTFLWSLFGGCFWLVENKCIFHATGVQNCKTSAKLSHRAILQIACTLLKLCLSWLFVILSWCKLLISNNMISHVISCKYIWALVNFSKTTNCSLPMGSCNFVVFQKFTCAYEHQITLKLVFLSIQIHKYCIFTWHSIVGQVECNEE